MLGNVTMSQYADKDDMINDLGRRLFQARLLYHRYGKSPISDDVYDDLKSKLRKLAPNHPEVTAVGAPPDPASPLEKVKHEIFMGSVYNSKDYSNTDDYLDGFKKWHDKLGNPALYGELKGDGLSLRLKYENGVLVQAATRGNGVFGEDVTHNVRMFRNVPIYTQNLKFTGEVRGEGILLNDDWKRLGDAGGKNPRNTAAGALGRKTGGEDVCKHMMFFAFDIIDPQGVLNLNFKTDKVKSLRFLGFQQFTGQLCNHQHDAIGFHEGIAIARPNLPHDIDGIVFYANDLEMERRLGYDSNNCWRTQVAFKFPAMEVTTKLNAIEWFVGHTGAQNPVAILEPVQCGGVTVSRASLANWQEIVRLKIAVGDEVVVARQGDVIPKVLRTVNPNATPSVQKPNKCACCGAPVEARANVKGDEGAILYCTNDDCPAKGLGKVKRWVSSLEIQGLGEEVIAALMNTAVYVNDVESQATVIQATAGELELPDGYKRIISTPADLYRLHELPASFIKQITIGKVKLGSRRYEAIVAEIEKKRKLTVDEILGSLGIMHLGKRRVEIIRKAFKSQQWDNGLTPDVLDTLDGWFTNHDGQRASILETYADRLGIPGIAVEVQAGIDRMKPVVEALLAAGVVVVPPPADIVAAADAKLAGQSFCFTGVRAKDEELTKLATLGGVEKGSVSKGLTYLVCKDPTSTSSKATKAREVGSKVISYEDFQQMLAL